MTPTPTPKKFKTVTHLVSDLDLREMEDKIPAPEPKPKPELGLRVLDRNLEHYQYLISLAAQMRRGLIEGTESRRLVDTLILRLTDQYEAILFKGKDESIHSGQ